MDMRETIKALRTIILEEMAKQRHNTYRFSPEDNERVFAQHPNCSADNTKNDEKTWESYLYTKDNIHIILSFNKRRQNSKTLPAIILHGHEFRSVSLFIYDFTSIGINSSKQDACTALEEFLNKGNSCYEITEVTERIINDPAQRETRLVGHVMNLTIRNEGKIWDIGPNMSKDQIEKATAGLVDKVVATLKDILPVAKYYADKREDLLAGKI